MIESIVINLVLGVVFFISYYLLVWLCMNWLMKAMDKKKIREQGETIEKLKNKKSFLREDF